MNTKSILYPGLIGSAAQVFFAFLGIASLGSFGFGCLFALFVPILVGSSAGFMSSRQGTSANDAGIAGAVAAVLASFSSGLINSLLTAFKILDVSAGLLEKLSGSILAILVFGALVWSIVSFFIGYVSGFITGSIFYQEKVQTSRSTFGFGQPGHPGASSAEGGQPNRNKNLRAGAKKAEEKFGSGRRDLFKK